MKKIIALILALFVLVSCMVIFSGCGNKMMFDTTYNFKYAYVVWPDGSHEELEIDAWMDYDGEQIQIKTTDGKVYLFSSYNCVLATDKK